MSGTPFMQLWVGDFIADTMHLTKAQTGEYLLLLMAMWKNGGTLPKDHKKLARIAKGAVSEAVMAFFEDDEQGGITQRRLQKEYERAVKKSQARSQSGKLGYQAKVLKNKEAAQAIASPLLKHLSESESESERKKEEVEASSDAPPQTREAFDLYNLKAKTLVNWQGQLYFLKHKSIYNWPPKAQ